MNGDAAAEPVAARAPTSRVGRLMVLMVVLLSAVFGGIGWLQTQSLALLNANVVYQGDNIVWSFFQLETESLRLGQMLRDVAEETQAGHHEALRERYELFVSRISLVEPNRTREVMPELEMQRQVLARLRDLVSRLDPLLGPEAPAQIDPARIRVFLPEFEALGKSVRDLSLLANQAVAETITRRNEAVRDQNRIGIGLTIFQFLMIGAFAFVVVRQVRALEQRRSELETLASRLQDARAEAEQASRTKSAFLANMSHELRTPFNGLLGMMSLLDRSSLTPPQREYLGIARQSGEHLLTILNDVLDFSKMESGRLELVARPTDLRQTVSEVQALMAPQARDKALKLEVDVAADLPEVVQADAKRVKQILFNLLGNAIKFTDAGRVGLTVDRGHTSTGRSGVRFRITDTGIGMGEETRTRLFQRFSQGDNSISRRFGGTGLGLEISRTLAELMDGEISVTSQVGRGSEFTVVLPLAALDPGALVAAHGGGAPVRVGSADSPASVLSDRVVPDAPAAGSLQVLVTDDHPVNRKFMQVLLERLGHRVLLATNGEEAVAIVREQSCDLVLMDVHMPVMDGLTAARTIRSLPLPASRVLIVALTADAFAESRERVRQSGMDDFLAKPVQLHDVEELLRKHFGARAVGSMGSGASPAAVPATASAAAMPASHVSKVVAATASTPDKPARRRRVRIKPGEPARVLDLAHIADTCAALSADAYRTLLAGFMSDESASLSGLLVLLEQGGEADERAKAAHRLKGAAASLGLRELAETAGALEADAASLTEESAPQMAQHLRTQFEAAREMATRLGWLVA
jgi:signal transduction histidine kinase/DNA-binding NarL/FixJ family response regulator/HPt (histidine-containing phosphotransfer) domain-containing protein